MDRAWAAGVVVLLVAACGRGPGTLAGPVEGLPFQLLQATWTIDQRSHEAVITAQDQQTSCGQRVKRGRIVALYLDYSLELPLPGQGTYPLSSGRGRQRPGVVGNRVIVDENCVGVGGLWAEQAEVEVVEVRSDPGTGGVEADLRVSLTFGGELLQGTLHATQQACPPNIMPFCDAN